MVGDSVHCPVAYPVKLNHYCTVYYCRLIYELCLHKQGLLLRLNCHITNCSTSLEISLPYQAVYQYLLDNPVSGPSFVPTVIAALQPSNTTELPDHATVGTS